MSIFKRFASSKQADAASTSPGMLQSVMSQGRGQGSPCDTPVTLTPSSTPRGSVSSSSLPPASPVTRPRSGTDPDTCLEVFTSHWHQALAIIGIRGANNSMGGNSGGMKRGMLEDMEAVMRYVDQMVLLLVEEEAATPGGGQGPILEYLLTEDILGRLLAWSTVPHHAVPPNNDLHQRLKLHHLKMYELLISQARQPLLLHKPVIRPMFKLLASCEQHPNPAVETRLILILHQLCVCVTQNKQILELLFDATADHGSSGFLMFSLLIPYTHREGAVGQQARDALLLIMALSYSHRDIGAYIADNSHFCPVSHGSRPSTY